MSAQTKLSPKESIVSIEGRVIAAERELRSIRAALATATRCSCPVGWGSPVDANCPKHGGTA